MFNETSKRKRCSFETNEWDVWGFFVLERIELIHHHRNEMKIFSVKFSIGILLAIASSLFIGTSFILKKKGLLRISSSRGAIRAGKSISTGRNPSMGKKFRIRRLWISTRNAMVDWISHNGLGWIVQFYCVWIRTCIGGNTTRCTFSFSQVNLIEYWLKIKWNLFSALLAVRFLGDKLNLFGRIGCILTISGSVILVIHAPKDSEVNSSRDFAERIKSPGKYNHHSFAWPSPFNRISPLLLNHLSHDLLFNHLLRSTIRW